MSICLHPLMHIVYLTLLFYNYTGDGKFISENGKANAAAYYCTTRMAEGRMKHHFVPSPSTVTGYHYNHYTKFVVTPEMLE